MKHVHHDMIVSWAADPSRVVQRYYGAGVWLDEKSPQWFPNDKYRFKPAEPKFITVNGIQVPEPVREPLERGAWYWLAESSAAYAASLNWHDNAHHKRWLSLGLIHLTREAAQAHIDAMLLPSRADK